MGKVTLGRGLEALLSGATGLAEPQRFALLDIDKVVANPRQPRQVFTEDSLSRLADSIQRNGMLQPLVVRPANSHFELVAGERRLRAAQMIGLKKVPALLMEGLTDVQQVKLALIENLQREDLNIMELAEGYARILSEYGVSQEDLAQSLSKDRSTITNTLRLLNLPEEIRQMLRAGRLSQGHARAILALADQAAQLELAQRVIAEGMSVRELESFVYDKPRKKRGRSLKVRRLPVDIAEAEHRLKRFLGTAVKIKRTLKKGTIEIEFYSDSDLTRILELIAPSV